MLEEEMLNKLNIVEEEERKARIRKGEEPLCEVLLPLDVVCH